MDNATGDGTQQEKAASSSQRLSLEDTAEPSSSSPRPENLRCGVQTQQGGFRSLAETRDCWALYQECIPGALLLEETMQRM